MGNDDNALILQLLRISTGRSQRLSRIPSQMEWKELFAMAVRQGITTFAFAGVERLPADQRPPFDVMMDWVAVADYVERRNRKLNATCVKVYEAFCKEGKKVCVLKGQGMSVLYPFPLRRDCGDIDLWMIGGKEKVEKYVFAKFDGADEGDGSHHVSFVEDDVEIEVHYMPTALYNPLHHRKLNSFFRMIGDASWDTCIQLPENAGRIVVPSIEFNLVFILVHMFHHWAFEGCGMKQLMDYFWLLEREKVSEDMKEKVRAQLNNMGLWHFLSAVMYIFELLGMEKKNMLCAPDRRLGKKLWADILAVGLVTADDLAVGRFSDEGKSAKFMRRLRRMWRLLPLAPNELPWVLAKSVVTWIRWNVIKK